MERYIYGWGGERGGVESNDVECRLKGEHSPNTNTLFHAKKLQHCKIAGRV